MTIVKTKVALNIRSGKRECWEARSGDDRFEFFRHEDTATTWAMFDTKTGARAFAGSLKKAAAHAERIARTEADAA